MSQKKTPPIPYDDIQALASRCRDPQQPEGIRESAAIVQRWLDGEPEAEETEDTP